MVGRPRYICLVPGCSRARTRGQVMCKPCWRDVPAELRSAVWEEATRRPGTQSHRLAVKAAIGDAYRRLAESRSARPDGSRA